MDGREWDCSAAYCVALHWMATLMAVITHIVADGDQAWLLYEATTASVLRESGRCFKPITTFMDEGPSK